jgi:hypothetical protein
LARSPDSRPPPTLHAVWPAPRPGGPVPCQAADGRVDLGRPRAVEQSVGRLMGARSTIRAGPGAGVEGRETASKWPSAPSGTRANDEGKRGERSKERLQSPLAQLVRPPSVDLPSGSGGEANLDAAQRTRNLEAPQPRIRRSTPAAASVPRRGQGWAPIGHPGCQLDRPARRRRWHAAASGLLDRLPAQQTVDGQALRSSRYATVRCDHFGPPRGAGTPSCSSPDAIAR